MFRQPLVSAAAILMLIVAVDTLAADTPRIDRREDRQEARIEQGRASGELTPREARRLERGQAAVDRKQARAEADGVVTARERARITGEQNEQSRRIRHQKHDRQSRDD